MEPLATFLEKYKAPTSTVTKHGDTIYVTGAPPFDPETGEIDFDQELLTDKSFAEECEEMGRIAFFLNRCHTQLVHRYPHGSAGEKSAEP